MFSLCATAFSVVLAQEPIGTSPQEFQDQQVFPKSQALSRSTAGIMCIIRA